MKTVKGNLLDMFDKDHFDVIAHGCNCFNSMSGGIAAQISQRYPQARLSDNATTPGDYLKLGSLSAAIISLSPKKLIFNLYTQFNGGANFDYTAARLSLRKLNFSLNSIKENLGRDVRVGLPMIGSGIGGGNWEKIEKMIKRELRSHDVTIVEFDQKVVTKQAEVPKSSVKIKDAYPSPGGVLIHKGSRWNYDKSLCMSETTQNLVVKEVGARGVRFMQKMKLDVYGLNHFDIGGAFTKAD